MFVCGEERTHDVTQAQSTAQGASSPSGSWDRRRGRNCRGCRSRCGGERPHRSRARRHGSSRRDDRRQAPKVDSTGTSGEGIDNSPGCGQERACRRPLARRQCLPRSRSSSERRHTDRRPVRLSCRNRQRAAAYRARHSRPLDAAEPLDAALRSRCRLRSRRHLHAGNSARHDLDERRNAND